MKKIFTILLLFCYIISVHGKINGECFAILIEPSQATGKYYQFYDAFNTDLVTAFWNKGKDVVAANKTRAGWLVATQNENKGSEQQIICDKLENVKAEATELAKKGKYVKFISISNWFKRIWMYFDKQPNITAQIITEVPAAKLSNWLEQHQSQGYRIVACVQQWKKYIVVAQKGTDIKAQEVGLYETSDEACKDVQKKWAENWRVGCVDVSLRNKYLVIYNKYSKPQKGYQYLAYCSSKEEADEFIKKRAIKGYAITHIGGSYWKSPIADENGDTHFGDIASGILTKSAGLYTDIKTGSTSNTDMNSGLTDYSTGSTNLSSCKTQADYQKEYDKWAEKALKTVQKHFKNGKLDSQNTKQGQITAGERKILRGYQKLMKETARSAAGKGFTLKRVKLENYVP